MSLVVKVFPADHAGCGFYRARLPVRTLIAGNVDAELITVNDPQDENSLEIGLDGRMGDVHVRRVADPECNVIVLQRPMHRYWAEAIPLIQAYGTAVVVELDDDFDSVDPKNPAWKNVTPSTSPESNRMWLTLATQMADLVTVSTAPLVDRYGKHGRVRLIPNYIPELYLTTPKRKNEHWTLGWTGSARTHPGDLAQAKEGMARYLTYNDGFRFRALGDTGTLAALGLTSPPHEAVEWVPVESGYAELVAGLDVGIAPLRATPFNRSKSYLKGLEYAACGVPFIASPLPEYRKLAHRGAGLLAAYPSDWGRRLTELEDDGRYAELAATGKAMAAENTIEGHAEEWMRAWADAVACRQAV